MPALKGTKESLSYLQCFLCLVPSSTNVSIFHTTWLSTFWKDLIYVKLHLILNLIGCILKAVL